ncbi:hypothetical protein H8356DRAFT_1434134 [Neocallimastix lanati (nom. inval.)]|nr:hypothetical protein H8356DRAFT_1434134 [Neocallimastix sp. JGI-2020a]
MEKNLEIEISKTNKGKEQIIFKSKNINLIFHPKGKNQILEYDDSRNHLENKFVEICQAYGHKNIKMLDMMSLNDALSTSYYFSIDAINNTITIDLMFEIKKKDFSIGD